MQMRSTAIDVVRDLVGERLPQVMQQLWQHLRELTGKVSLKPPRLPSQPSGALHWISWRTVLAAALLGGEHRAPADPVQRA